MRGGSLRFAHAVGARTGMRYHRAGGSMTLELAGPQQRTLRDALVDAFRTWTELSELTLFQLDLNLGAITDAGGGLNKAAFDLVQWAAARGLLANLIVAARNERPRNPKVNALADLLRLSSCSLAVLEKFVSDNQVLLDAAAWREGQAHAEWRVCRVERAGDAVGTAILVGPDLVLTNYHVVERLLHDPGDAAAWRARFDYKATREGSEAIAGIAVGFAADWDVDHAAYSHFDLVPDPKGGEPSPDELDHALIRLAAPIGEQPVGGKDSVTVRGWTALHAAPIDYDRRRMIAILQHPRGRPMKLALGMTERLTVNAAGNRIRHGVPTEPGSSGSPLFDQDWKLIALHHAGDPTTIKPEYNEAIPIGLIAARPRVAAALPRV
jgi:hypothetical protein